MIDRCIPHGNITLWGYVRSQVISVQVHSLSHMRKWIKQALADVSTDTLQKLWKLKIPELPVLYG